MYIFSEMLISKNPNLLFQWRSKKSSLIIGLALITSFLTLTLNHSQLIERSFSLNSDYIHQSILIDQFGYRPRDRKVAVIIQPESSSNTEDLSLPKQFFDTYQVISSTTSSPVYEGIAQIWQDGAIHSQSGDRAAWFDFSEFQEPGLYTIQNIRTGDSSAQFKIAEHVYQPIITTATRMFFYQRSGFAKQPPHADPRWTDEAAFLGPKQDLEASLITDRENPTLRRDVQGGWFDAGDTNKYVTFAIQAIHQLLYAYTQNPGIWRDDFNIPESNNGIPDLLDEIQIELDWFRRMQDDDGGVFIKVGTLDYNWAEKPSLDQRPRFYGPKCSSSTIGAASVFAHAALVFKDISSLTFTVSHFQQQALLAWQWFQSNPIQTDCDNQEIKAGDADRSRQEQIDVAVSAAIYLFALTHDNTYENYIISHLHEVRPFTEQLGSIYEPSILESLLFYAQLDNANPEMKSYIENRSIEIEQHLLNLDRHEALDPYQAYLPDDQYHWGSNIVKANLGNAMADITTFLSQPEQLRTAENRALGIIHYLHGVNPLGLVYLSNMYDDGAEYSVNEMYHEWFGQGVYKNALTSPNGPAPGYLTGGPNKNYTGTAPLTERPPMRAYLDSSEGGDLKMWEITEPSIAYQAGYIKLLSRFLAPSINK